MLDSLRFSLYVGLASLVVMFASLGYFAWQSAGSRNLALATATLAAAGILFVVQLRFELRADEATDFITAEYTIDRAKPEIRQWNYSANQGRRLGQEIGASQTFAAAHPGQFNGDRQKMTIDMTIFSLLSYLGVEQFDWQIKRTQFVGPSMGTLTLTAPGSKPGECSTITKDDLHNMLLAAGNLFAEGNIFFGRQSLCLPPRSILRVASDGITITNPFCKISFTLVPSGSISFTTPGTQALQQPVLQNNEPQFETTTIGIRVEIEYTGIRAQHRDMPKYQEWARRVITGAQNWFMG